jgi:trigger factor
VSEQEKTGEQSPNETPEPVIPNGEGAVRVGPYQKKDLETPPAPESEGTTQPESAEQKEEDKVSYELLESQDKPGSIRQYKVKIPMEEYDNRQSKMIRDLKKTVVIDGFRKGKAPDRFIKNRFRKELRQDVMDDIVPKITDDLLKKAGAEKFTDPVIEDTKGEEGENIELLFHVEILPRIELKPADYTGMDITVKRRKLTDDLVTKQLEDLQKRNAVFEPKEGPVDETDGVVLNILVEDEKGNEIKEMGYKNALIQYPAQYLPREVYQILLGKEKGIGFEVKVPRESPKPEGGGVSAQDTWKVEIVEVKKCVLPKMDDEFAKDLGNFKTLEELKSKIRSDMESHAESHAREDAFEAIMQKIIENKSFDPPASLVEHYKRGMISEDLKRLRQIGLSFKDMKLDPEQYMSRKHKDADLSVKASFLLREVISGEKLEVADQDLEAELAKIAEKEGRKPLAIRAKLEADGQLDSFRDDLLHDKVKQLLLEKNNVKYEEADQQS